MLQRYRRGSVFVGNVADLYPLIPDGSVDVAIVDGPYDMGKGTWDAKHAGGALAQFYAPHVAELPRICAPSSSVYVWGTGRSWSAVDPIVRAAGFVLHTLITWDKGETIANRGGVNRLHGWPESSEFCGFYTRDEWNERDEVDAWNRRVEDHPVRRYFEDALRSSGLGLRDVDRALEGRRAGNVRGLARHYFTASQWCLPGVDLYRDLVAVVPTLTATWEDLRAGVDAVEEEHRAELSLRRAYFDGIAAFPASSVWREEPVPKRERVRNAAGVAHPCQKPIALYRRMIRASCPPAGAVGARRGRPAGGLVFEPFAGSLRSAAFVEGDRQVRRYLSAELDGGFVADAVARFGTAAASENASADDGRNVENGAP